MKPVQEKIKRLRWQCRRGMLELDLLLGAFLHHYYLSLIVVEQDLFDQLLTYSDQDLYRYLIKQQCSQDQAMQALIERVRCGC
jgi:antitoxin CptB